METSSFSIFQFSLIVFLLAGLLIFTGFRMLRFLMQFFRLTHQQVRFLNRFLPLIEMIAWMLFLLWSIQYLHARYQLISLIPMIIFIILVLYLAWYALKDITAGIIFKTGQAYQLNDQINVSDVTGKIASMGMRSLEIEDKDGQMVSIPYSRIVGNVMLRSYPSQSLLSHTFRMEVPVPSTGDIFSLQEKIRAYILSMPWASQKKEPRIHMTEETPDHILFQVTIFSLDESYFRKTEKLLEKQFEAKVNP